MRPIDADALERKYMVADYLDNDTAYDVIAEIDSMPTIEPERKKGKWIVGANHGLMVHTLTCDQCNHSEVSSSVPNFCPNCGADMRGEQNGRIDMFIGVLCRDHDGDHNSGVDVCKR